MFIAFQLATSLPKISLTIKVILPYYAAKERGVSPFVTAVIREVLNMENQMQNTSLIKTETFRNKITAMTGKLLILSGLAFLCLACTACSPFISSKDSIILYAQLNYGKSSVIYDEEGGTGKDRYRTVYFQDKETGIVYEVTSELDELNIDGPTGLAFECKSSNFEEQYVKYVMDLSDDDLEEIMDDNNLVMNRLADYEYYFLEQSWEFLSEDMIDGKTAEKLAKEICDVVRKNDCKNLITIRCSMYAENPESGWKYDPSDYDEDEKVFFFENECFKIGEYNTSDKKWVDSYIMDAIEYMHENYRYDPAFADYDVYEFGVLMTIRQMREFYPGKDRDDKVRCYKFSDKYGLNYYVLTPYEEGKAPKEYKLFKESEDRSSGLCICLEPIG